MIKNTRMLTSASLGAKNKDGILRAMYEPIHGSAPDIAGKGIANPIASILSFAMALKYSLNLDNEANALEKAVQDVLDDGLRTKDIISKGTKEVSTCLLYASPSPRDRQKSSMKSSA